jgi:hypothetical protein
MKVRQDKFVSRKAGEASPVDWSIPEENGF